MRALKIPFPDVSRYWKSRLFHADEAVLSYNPGDMSLYVRNVFGLKKGDYLVVDAFESQDAEIVRINDIDVENRLVDLVSPLKQPHAVGVVVQKTPFDKVKIYKGTSSEISEHVLQGTIDLSPASAHTYWYDKQGMAADYYSYAYYDSVENFEDTRILYEESDYDAVLTVQQLKDWFMFGLDLTDDDGYPFPVSQFEFAIRSAVDWLERILDIKIKPTQIIGERRDYYRNEYMDFAFIQLSQYPIVSVEKVAIKYPTGHSEIVFPKEWYQINKEHGQIHLIPTSGSLSQILVGRGGDYLTFVWRGFDFMPNLWIIDYTAGFEKGKVPHELIDTVGMLACFMPLNTAGDLVGGVAVASKSMGIDGLSVSLNTTSSAENAGYSARLRQYERTLKDRLPRLITYYKGIRATVC